MEDTDEESDSDLDDDPGTNGLCVQPACPAPGERSDKSEASEESDVFKTETTGECNRSDSFIFPVRFLPHFK